MGLRVVHHREQVRRTIQEESWLAFLGGGTTHSAKGIILTHLIERCEREKVPYTLHAVPGQGYRLEPLDKKLLGIGEKGYG